MTQTSGTGGQTGSLLTSSAVMAAGTVVSRLSGFVRSILLAAALGNGLHADVFNIANTVPNMLYILLAGGVVNAVLVPQLVRSMKRDPDGGTAYTSRIITLAALFLTVVTAILVVGAPWLMHLFLDGRFYTASCAPQLESVIVFARYCLPQVFFYGMFVLVGQVLNARGRFGPMMWAPIANNVVSVAVLAAYLVLIGPAEGSALEGGYGARAEALLGLGSTAGIVVQLLVLLPYLRATGFRFRPRFDFRGSGLGHTLRLGVWTVLFVVVNQVAFTVVVRLSSSGTVGTGRCGTGGSQGTGYTVYSNAFLLSMVPHSVVTVSLATALLPALSAYAADGQLSRLGAALSRTLRSAYALVVPFAAVTAVVAVDASQVIWGYGSSATVYANFAPSLILFVAALVPFTAHFLMLRGFYALEQNRRVFWIQCVIGVVNVVAALVLVPGGPPSQTAPRLVLAYALSYVVGAALSSWLLSREVGGLQGREVLRFAVRLVLAAGIAAGAAAATQVGMLHLLSPGATVAAVGRLVVAGLVYLVVYVLLARALRIGEVGQVMAVVGRRLGR